MDKKELKFYVTPSQEIVQVEVEGQLLAGSTNANGVTTDPLPGAGDLYEPEDEEGEG